MSRSLFACVLSVSVERREEIMAAVSLSPPHVALSEGNVSFAICILPSVLHV